MRDRQGGDRQHEFPTVSRGGGFGDGVEIGAVDKVEFQRSCTVYPPHDAEEENCIGDRRKSGTDEQHLEDGLAIFKKMLSSTEAERMRQDGDNSHPNWNT